MISCQALGVAMSSVVNGGPDSTINNLQMNSNSQDISSVKEKKIISGGDDLGRIWHDFYGMSMANVMDWIKRKGFDQYEVVKIKYWRRFWFVGEITHIHVLMEKLEGLPSGHASEFADLLKWVRDHGRGHSIEFSTLDNRSTLVTINDKEANKQYTVTVLPEKFKEYCNEPGMATHFLEYELWDKLHPKKVHTI